MNISTCLSEAACLQTISHTARLDTEVLLAHALGKSRTYLYTWPEMEVPVQDYATFNALMAARKKGEPVAYLTGRQEFWSLSLQTNRHTLIPRPETELLVETTLALAANDKSIKTILDLGTGTGAIALALACEKNNWSIQGVDLEPDAVNIAQKNAQALKLNNVSFFVSNWFGAVSKASRFDVIVSNPPYIDADDAHLCEGDVQFEPRSALVASEKGLADLRYIIESAHAYLHEAGWLLLEHGWQQGEAVRLLLTQAGYSQVTSRKDLAGIERISYGRLMGIAK